MAGIKKVNDYRLIVSEETKEAIIKDYVKNFLSIRDLCVKYNITSKTFISNVISDVKRTPSQSRVIAHKRYPDAYKHTEKSKAILREKRLKYMKEHPENTAWRQKNVSYPEQCFINMLHDYGFDRKYLIYKEYSVFPYFIDFAFIDMKLAVEVDGAQHLEPERAERDRKKDNLLVENGWSVIRFTASDVMRNSSMVADILKEHLETVSTPLIERIGILKSPTKKEHKNGSKTKKEKVVHVGILKAPKTRQPIPREVNGRTKLQNEASYKQRKVKNRPSKEELEKLTHNESFIEIGRRYGVSDNTIRKWCKQYGLEYRKKDMK